MLNRQISAKKAWARLEERATLGEKFGFLGCLSLFRKMGIITADQVLVFAREAHITNEDLRKFREQTGQVNEVSEDAASVSV